jgi:hypothetical protein
MSVSLPLCSSSGPRSLTEACCCARASPLRVAGRAARTVLSEECLVLPATSSRHQLDAVPLPCRLPAMPLSPKEATSAPLSTPLFPQPPLFGTAGGPSSPSRRSHCSRHAHALPSPSMQRAAAHGGGLSHRQSRLDEARQAEPDTPAPDKAIMRS